MPNTPRGITYPDSGGHTRLWEHLQTLADTTDDALDAIAQEVAYTPTLGGVVSIGTGGGAIVDAAYTILGDWLFGRCRVKFGTSGLNLSGAGFSISMPTGKAPKTSSWRVPGHVDLYDADAAQAIRGSLVVAGGSAFLASPGPTAGGYDRAVTNIAPFTWAAGDSFDAYWQYPVT